MKIKAEFHCHTTASDGNFSPTEVVQLAHKNGVEILSITDHDTVDGLIEANHACKELNIKFIPGIELSCNHNKESIHILGFFKGDGYKSKELIDFLHNLKASRVLRAKAIVDKLKEHFNIDLNYEDVLSLSDGVIARPHIAQAIINAGYDYSMEYIFDNFIGNDSPAYVPNKYISITEGIEILKKYGCIVILAHPKLIKKTPLKDFLKFDFDGIEAIYYQNFKRETDELISIANSKGLLVTCGSDFHGISDDDKKHGMVGDMEIDDYFLNKFMMKLSGSTAL